MEMLSAPVESKRGRGAPRGIRGRGLVPLKSTRGRGLLTTAAPASSAVVPRYSHIPLPTLSHPTPAGNGEKRGK